MCVCVCVCVSLAPLRLASLSSCLLEASSWVRSSGVGRLRVRQDMKNEPSKAETLCRPLLSLLSGSKPGLC